MTWKKRNTTNAGVWQQFAKGFIMPSNVLGLLEILFTDTVDMMAKWNLQVQKKSTFEYQLQWHSKGEPSPSYPTSGFLCPGCLPGLQWETKSSSYHP